MRQDLDIIKNSIRKAIDIVDDLLALGKIGYYQPSLINFKNVYDNFAKSAPFTALKSRVLSVEFIEEFCDNIPEIMGSEQHLKEMLLNLMIYAFEAAGENGKIKIALEPEVHEQSFGNFETIEKGKYLVFSIRYSGKPLTDEEISRFFEPFFLKQHFNYSQGSGLGLALVYGVIKEHKGFVDVISESENINVIKIYLPIADATYTAPLKQQIVADLSKSDSLFGTETVLIVDDSDEERRTIARYLRTYGYKTIMAPDGKSAIEIVSASQKGESAKIDIMLLDMIMADNFDGLDVYKKILEIDPRQKAVIMSGFAGTERIKEAMKLGANAYLQKPFEEKELVRAVRKVLDEGS